MQKHVDQCAKLFDQALNHAKAAEERKKQEEEAEAGAEGEKKPEVRAGLGQLGSAGEGQEEDARGGRSGYEADSNTTGVLGRSS